MGIDNNFRSPLLSDSLSFDSPQATYLSMANEYQQYHTISNHSNVIVTYYVPMYPYTILYLLTTCMHLIYLYHCSQSFLLALRILFVPFDTRCRAAIVVAKDPGTGRFDGGAHEQTVGSTHGVASFRQLFWPLQETGTRLGSNGHYEQYMNSMNFM